MPTTQVAIRIGVDGKAEVKRAFDETGKAGQDAFNGVAGATNTASEATDRQTEKLRRLADAARKAGEAQAAQGRFNAVLGVNASPAKSASDSASVFVAQAKAEDDLAARTRALKAEIDPLWAAQEKLGGATRNADELFKAGKITAEEHGSAIKNAKTAYSEAEKGLKKLGDGVKLNRGQFQELTGIARHSFDALAAGSPITTVLTTHIASLGQALGAGEGGVMGGLSAVAGLFNPFVVGAVLVTGAVIAATKATLDYEAAERKLAAAAQFTGAGSGATIASLDAITAAAVKSGAATVASAREMEAAFLSSGKIGVENFSGLIAVQKDYAAATGMESKEATAALVKAFSDPAKGAADLTDKLHFLNAAQLDAIDKMVKAGDRTGAQTVLLNDLQRATAGASAQTEGLSAKLKGVTEWFGNAWAAAGRYFDRLAGGGTTSERISDLLQKRARLTVNPVVSFINQGDVADVDRELAQLRAKLFIDTKKEQDRTATAQRNDRSRVLAGEVDAIDPKDHRVDEIRSKQTDLRQALADPAMLAAMGKSREEVERAIAAGDKQIAQLQKVKSTRDKHGESLAREAASMEVNTAGQIALTEAYLKSDDAALLAEARRKASTDATRKGIDVDEQARRQIALNVAEQAAAGAKRYAALRDQTEGQKAVNDAIAAGTLSVDDASRAMTEEQALRPLLTLQTLAHAQGLEKEEAAIRRVIAALKTETAESETQKARLAGFQTIANDNDRLDRLKLEIKYAGDLTGELQRQEAIKHANDEADKAHFSPEDRKTHVDNAVSEANLQIEKSRTEFVRSTIREQGDSLELTRAEIGLVGASAATHDLVIARLREEQTLKARGVDLTSGEAKAILSNVDAIERENQKLQQTQANWQELKSAGESLVDKLGEGLSSGTWDGWKSAGLSALKELEQEFLKLAVLNPIKNALFGGNAPTLSSVGGLFGSFFGGGAGAGGGAIVDSYGATGGLNFGSGGSFTSSLVSGLPGYATGTDSAPGGLSWVGEKGPELLNIPRGAQVFNHGDSLAMARAAAAQPANDVRQPVVNVTIQASDPQQWKASKAQIAAQLSRAVAQGQRIR